MILCELQFPFVGQESLSLHLEVHFVSSGGFENLLISALVWLEMMVLTLLTQP